MINYTGGNIMREKDRKDKYIVFRVDEKDLKRLNRKAKTLNVTRSDVIRELLKYLSKLRN